MIKTSDLPSSQMGYPVSGMDDEHVTIYLGKMFNGEAWIPVNKSICLVGLYILPLIAKNRTRASNPGQLVYAVYQRVVSFEPANSLGHPRWPSTKVFLPNARQMLPCRNGSFLFWNHNIVTHHGQTSIPCK